MVVEKLEVARNIGKIVKGQAYYGDSADLRQPQA